MLSMIDRLRIVFVCLIIMLAYQRVWALEPDVVEIDTTANEVDVLDEVIVEGESIVRKGNTTILFPTYRDRRFASGGIDVLANMNIPDVIVNPLNQNITSAGGEEVSLFIDFEPATAEQMRSIRPQDIARIDIIRSPEDSRFQNARIVANFIMKKYEYGGYTKFDASQAFPTSKGNYEVYSKLSYKRLTYDITGGMGYTYSGNRAGEEDYAIFKFPMETIERQSIISHNKKRVLNPSVTARAKYLTNNVLISNTLGFDYTRLNPANQIGQVKYSDIFPSNESDRKASGINKVAVWKGNYWLRLTQNSSLNFYGSFKWGENRDFSTYTLGEFSPIVNNISEKILDANGNLNYSKGIGEQSIGVGLAGGWSTNRLDYVSSETSEVYYREGYGKLNLSADLSFNKFSISPSVSLSISSERLNSDIATKWLPKAFVPFYMQLTKRSSINGSFEYAKGAAPASYRSPVIVRQNEIEVLRGNEHLSDYDMYQARLGYSHYFGSWLAMNFDIGFHMQDNVLVPIFVPETSEEGMPLMVTDISNNGVFYKTTLAINLRGEYFDRRLAVALGGDITYFAQRTDLIRNRYNPNFYVNATCYLGAFRISGYYSLKHKNCTVWYDMTTGAYYYISGSWSWKDLFVDVRISNPFRRSYIAQWTEFESDKYSDYHIYKSPTFHQTVTLTLSYSFSYGKKVDHRNEVGKIADGASIILRK